MKFEIRLQSLKLLDSFNTVCCHLLSDHLLFHIMLNVFPTDNISQAQWHLKY